MEIANGYTTKLKQTVKHYFTYLGCWQRLVKKTKSEFCSLSTTLWLAKPHWHVLLLPTYNANTHTECFINNKTSYCNTNVGKMSNFFSTQDVVNLLVKQTKSEVFLHSQPHSGQPKHTAYSRTHSMCDIANSMHANMYSTWAYYLSKPSYSMHHCKDKFNEWKSTKDYFFLLRMSVST